MKGQSMPASLHAVCTLLTLTLQGRCDRFLWIEEETEAQRCSSKCPRSHTPRVGKGRGLGSSAACFHGPRSFPSLDAPVIFCCRTRQPTRQWSKNHHRFITVMILWGSTQGTVGMAHLCPSLTGVSAGVTPRTGESSDSSMGAIFWGP